MAKTTRTEIDLRNGVSIPALGLGVFRAQKGEATRNAVLAALQAGYRHIDTAAIYGNEQDVGDALKESGVARSEVFVTTKLWNEDHGFEAALRAFDASSKRMGLEYVDLYLIHWPVPELRRESWKALERLYDEKRARAVGVSNYMVNHLEELAASANTPPSVNQIEVHPFLQQRDVRDWCAAHDIVVEAYSPLTKGHKLSHPVVLEVADAVKRTPAQVLLRWGLQREMVVLPKSTQPARIVENSAIFDFELDKAHLEKLDQLEQGLATGWDPRGQP